MNRRSLFGMLAASPVIVTSTVIAHANESLEPESTILMLQAQRIRESNSSNGTMFLSMLETHGPQLGISVGKDGNMWVKVDQKWKRVVTE